MYVHIRVHAIHVWICTPTQTHAPALAAAVVKADAVDSLAAAVAVCCSVLQCVAVCCSAVQCVAVRCSALQCVAVSLIVLQCVAVRTDAVDSLSFPPPLFS